MKILHINPYPPDHLGGSEIFCKNITLNLKKRKNIDCDILTSDIFKRNLKFEKLENIIKVYYKKCFHNLWEKNPIVNVIPFLLKNYKNYDIIDIHSYIFFTSFEAALLRKLFKVPLVLHVHGGVQTPTFISSNFRMELQILFKNYIFDKIFGKFVSKSADAVISVSDQDLKALETRYNLHKKNYYIPNGVDIDKFKQKKDITRRYISFIGRLSYIKGIDIFLEIIKRLYNKDKSLKFLIIGDGPFRNKVNEVAKKVPITFYRYYPYDSIEDIYNKSKILMLTSRFEGLPTVLIESLACETPIAATNVGGVLEILEPDKNGVIINHKDFNNTVNNILEFVNNEKKLKEFGRNGRELVEKKFSLEIITEKTADVYKQLLDD